MRKLSVLLVATLFALSMTGCAAQTGKSTMTKVKCPACGYEFQVPASQ